MYTAGRRQTMSKATAYITGAGDFCSAGFHPKAGDFVIAADGGYDALCKAGFRPDLVLGDMDSIAGLPAEVARLRFPASKDMTDMALCIRLAKGRGYRRFKLYGALGGRLDHSIANLQLLANIAREGMYGSIIAPDSIIYAVCNGSLALPPIKRGSTISVFSWGETAQGVSLRGLRYTLHNAQLHSFEPLGVSNESSRKPVRITVNCGVLLVVIMR